MKDKYEGEKVNREDRVTGGREEKERKKKKKKRNPVPVKRRAQLPTSPPFIRGEQRLGSTFSGAKFAFPCP